MDKGTRRRAHRAAVLAVCTIVLTISPGRITAGAETTTPIVRVRSSDRSRTSLIDQATQRSPTFRRLLTAIQASSGIVYIEPGPCGHGVRACLKMWMHVSGPDRFVRILIHQSSSDTDVDVMAALGHELQHAIEVLAAPEVRDGVTMFSYLKRTAPTDNNRFETTAAINAGNAVYDELRRSVTVGRQPPGETRRLDDPVPRSTAADTDQLPIAHIRSSSRVVRSLVRDAFTRSPTFRQITEMIEMTDGIVYVEEGKCGHSVRACLVLGVAISGPNRLLRILVDARKADWDLQGSIGHELRHAVEVLSDPAVRSDGTVYHFYASEGSHQVGGFETQAAIEAGETVRAELRRQR